MAILQFWRAHGLGNDYLVLHRAHEIKLSPELVGAICDRHRGLGSDGVLEPIAAPDGADFAVRIHNPDGSEAEKSGNGLRIFALWCVRHRGAPDSFTVWTSGGIVHCVVSGENVRVNMGVASTWGPEQIAGFEAYRVNMGNPHAVIFAQPPDWRTAGSVIENAVPGRTNVQFVEMLGSTPSILIWERGAGETMSSGSSACAVATICVQHGFCTSPVTVKMPGGSLLIWVGEQIEMEGPVEAIGMVDVDPTWISRRF